MKRNLLISIICTLLIVLWVYAALSKLVDFTIFGNQLKRQPLPVWSLLLLKWGLPALELVTALLIYYPRTRLTGFITSSILMVSFTLYVLFALSGAFGDIPCSCAGIISGLQWRGHLVFNIIFMIFSSLGVYLQQHKDDDFVKHRLLAV